MNALRALALPKLFPVFERKDNTISTLENRLKKNKQLQKGKWRIKKTSKRLFHLPMQHPWFWSAAVVTGDTSGIVASLHCLAMEGGHRLFCLFTLHSYGEGGK